MACQVRPQVDRVHAVPDHERWPGLDPVRLGPTWAENPDWRPGDPPGLRYALPEFSLGWQVLQWIRDNLLGEEPDEHGDPLPFTPTFEQARFILWFYAIDRFGRFLYRDVVLQRLKGWGKDPVGAVIACVELIGPCRFGGWLGDDAPALGLRRGDPFGVENRSAWVIIAAVTKEQTRNTMALFPNMIRDATKIFHGMPKRFGAQIIYAHNNARLIQAVTSNPRALEGNRPSMVLVNETHHFLHNNKGHEMWRVLERNAVKRAGQGSRTFCITNAHNPAEGSVGQMIREQWEDGESGKTYSTGIMYDSLEAPAAAGMRPPEFDDPEFVESLKDNPGEEERLQRNWLATVVDGVRGDAKWLDLDAIASTILRPREGETFAMHRRFWFNQVWADEETWLDPAAASAAVDPIVAELRRSAMVDGDRAGWRVVDKAEPVVMFLDASKSQDATGLVGCRLSDGYTFVIGVWQAPPARHKRDWRVPLDEVDARVQEALGRFNVQAFWGDPSHARRDEDSTQLWQPYFDKWHRALAGKIDKRWWALKSGVGTHVVSWDMSKPENLKRFIRSAEATHAELTMKDASQVYYAPAFRIDGHPALMDHLRNARIRYTILPGGFEGESVGKESRDSSRKMDLVVCAIGAQLLRRVVLNLEATEYEEPYVAIGYYG